MSEREQFEAECRAIVRRGQVALDVCVELADRYCEFDGNSTGGSLHIVLDDGNQERGDVEFSLRWAIDHGDTCGEWLARVLLLLDDHIRAEWLASE